MEKVKFIWLDGKFVNWERANIHILSHCLHYGSGAFEGIRCYQTDNGPAVFRLKDHLKRLFSSAKVLKIKIPFSPSYLQQAIIALLKKNKVEEGYIRPIVFYGYGKMGLDPTGAKISTALAVWRWGKYLQDAVRAKISKYIRIHPQSVVVSAKICGYYINSILATFDAKDKGYDEAILLDYRGMVAEGPGENIFIVKNKRLYTPKLISILPGITRDSVIKIAKDLGINFQEKDISVKELKNADEAFFTGTAAEITPIIQIDNKLINKGKIGEITNLLKERFNNIIRGRVPKYKNWLTYFKIK